MGELFAELRTKNKRLTLSKLYDKHEARMLAVPDYNANPTTLEKYGDPRRLPPSA